MNKLVRQPKQASEQDYDAIIIGGGVYGIMVGLEASMRNLKVLLLERDDFGQHTSHNWLRIIHGGLRYLQSLDLARFRESVSERAWFIKTFPEHVQILPCLMPLYGKGLKRPAILRLALKVNDFLSFNRNKDISLPHLKIGNGTVVSDKEVIKLFPMVARKNLMGGALWYDAFVPDSNRLLIDVLKFSCDRGATALNYCEAKNLIRDERGRIGSVEAIDRTGGGVYRFKTKVVINVAGPWCRDIAEAFDCDQPDLFKPSIAWNYLLNRDALSSCALALSPTATNAHTYFLTSLRGKLFAGTGHKVYHDPISANPVPAEKYHDDFIADLNAAVPGLGLKRKDILKTFSGFLPARKNGSAELATRPHIVDHGKDGRCPGLFSLSGVKFTTSRREASKLLDHIFGRAINKQSLPLTSIQKDTVFIFIDNYINGNNSTSDIPKNHIEALIENESVMFEEDFFSRRLVAESFSDLPETFVETAKQMLASKNILSSINTTNNNRPI